MKKKTLIIMGLTLSLVLVLFMLHGSDLLFAQDKGTQKKDPQLQYVADVISVQGEGLRIKRTNSPHWVFGKVNMPDYLKDIIETDKNTMACIEFMNGSQVGVNKSTQIEIISTYEVKDITNRSAIEKIVLKSGTMWAKVRNQKEPLKVQAGKGVMGIKGTEFIVESDPSTDTEKLTVLEGEVEYTPEKGEQQAVSSGEEISIDRENKVERRRVDIKKLRDALNLRFPGLNPGEQAIVGVFSSHLYSRMSYGAANALNIANQTTYLVEDPDGYLKDRATSEVGNRTGVYIPGGIFGRKEKRQERREMIPQNLSPDNEEISTYYPKFTWDKVEGAKSYRVLVTRKPFEKGVDDPLFYMFGETENNELVYPSYARSLKPDETYFWTVIPLGEDKKPVGRAARPVRINMADYKTLGIKGLSPCGGMESVQGNLSFDWTPIAGVDKYKIVIASNENLENPLITREVDANNLVLENASNYFFAGKDYYWQAVPVTDDEELSGITGAVNHFKVVGAK